MTSHAEEQQLPRAGRDADATRGALVRAARRRFATDGYKATTVRHIAADAGVNVALINRYFDSKEGLFEACILRTSNELDSEAQRPSQDLDAVIQRLIAHVIDSPNSDNPLQLLLLLRSSGDDGADLIRRRTLETFTRKLATASGWREGDPETAGLLLRAQLAIAAMLGVVMLRTSALAEPLASATEDEMAQPLAQLLGGALGRTERPIVEA